MDFIGGGTVYIYPSDNGYSIRKTLEEFNFLCNFDVFTYIATNLTQKDCEELKKMGWSEQEIETLKEINKTSPTVKEKFPDFDNEPIPPFEFDDLPGDPFEERHKCRCDSKDLFNYGCRCKGV